MVDTQKLYKAIEKFEFRSHPSSAISSTPATVGDINKLIKNTTELLRTFASELEQ